MLNLSWSRATFGARAVPRANPVSHTFSLFQRSYAAPAVSAEQDHYANLGVPTSATRKQIRDKFYEVRSPLAARSRCPRITHATRFSMTTIPRGSSCRASTTQMHRRRLR